MQAELQLQLQWTRNAAKTWVISCHGSIERAQQDAAAAYQGVSGQWLGEKLHRGHGVRQIDESDSSRLISTAVVRLLIEFRQHLRWLSDVKSWHTLALALA